MPTHSHEHSHEHEHGHNHEHDANGSAHLPVDTDAISSGNAGDMFITAGLVWTRPDHTIGMSSEDLQEHMYDAETKYTTATHELAVILGATIVETIAAAVPDTKYVVIREATDHLPAHGHVEAIIMNDGDRFDMTDWHDLDWTLNVDDLVYDFYQLVPHKFAYDREARLNVLVLAR